MAIAPLAAYASSCQTQCEPGQESDQGYVDPSPVPNSTTWLGLVPTPTPAQATPAINFGGETSTPVDQDEMLGWSFTVPAGQSVVVTQLGVWDGPSAQDSPAPGDGLGEDHNVTIWDQNGVVVAGATVSTTDPEDANNFVYHTLDNAVTLQEGTYFIGAYYSVNNVDPVAQNASPFGITSPLVFNGSASAVGNNALTATDGTGNSYFGPNFIMQPGPSSSQALTFSCANSTNTDPGATIGWTFTVNRPVTVTGLGVWDQNGDGLLDSHPVAIFNANGTIVVQAVVPAGTAAPADNTNGQPIRYVPVVPTTLPNGKYAIGAYYPTDDNQNGDDAYVNDAGGITTDPRLTYGQAANTNNCFLCDPQFGNVGGTGYFGPDFQVEPEQPKDQYLVDVHGNHLDWRGLEVDVTITPNEPGEDFDVYVYEAVPSQTVGQCNTARPNIVSNNDQVDYKEGPLVAYAAHRNGDPETATFLPSELSTGLYLVDVYYVSGDEIVVAPPNSYMGSATVTTQAGPAGLNGPTYTTAASGGSIKFGPNITVKAPFAPADGNPQDRTDILGNHYTGGMRGNPTGADLWYIDLRPTVDDGQGNQIANPNYDPNTRVPLYRYKFMDNSLNQTFDDYLALAVGFDAPTLLGVPSTIELGTPALAFSLLRREFENSIFSGNSYNRGFDPNFDGTVNLGTDQNNRQDLAPQQWEEFLGANVVYMLYRTNPYDGSFSFSSGPTGEAFVNRSDDQGFSFGSPAQNTGIAIGQLGPVDVDQNDGTVCGAGRTGNVLCGVPTPTVAPDAARVAFKQATRALVSGDTPPAPDAYNLYKAATDPNGVGHALFVTKIADDGILYGVYSNGQDIFLVSSPDKGQTWSNPTKVNGDGTTQPDLTKQTNIFPWLETGPTGKVGVVWYATFNSVANNVTPTPLPTFPPLQPEQTERQGNNVNADWKVYFAQISGANTTAPVIEIAEVTEPEHYVHSGMIWDGGCDPLTDPVNCANISETDYFGHRAPNHNLFDYIQLSFDPQGAAVVSYTDDHNDYRGNIYVARQISGPGINGVMLPELVQGKAPEGATLAPPAPCNDLGYGFPFFDDHSPCYEFPPPQPDPQSNAQVTDFAFDYQHFEVGGGGQEYNDSWDIRTIRYGSTGAAGNLSIFSAMTVSDLNAFTPFSGECFPFGCNGPFVQAWRMSFSINPPHGGVSATDPTTGQYSFALSDRGDQFYLEARVNLLFFLSFFFEQLPSGDPFNFVWGTATRNQDGTLTFSELGPADYGFVSFATNTIYVQLGVDKINGWLTPIGHPPIGNKSLVAGLRGRTLFDFDSGVPFLAPSQPSRSFFQDDDGVSGPCEGPCQEEVVDETRGGTEFTIVDTSAPGTTVQFASDHYTVNEGDGHVTITITRTGDTSGSSSVTYTTSNGSATAPDDYVAKSETVTFGPGETTITTQITINDDPTPEGNEDFTVTLSNPVGATLGAPSVTTVTISDNDVSPTPTPTASPAIVDFDEAIYDVNEGDGNAIVTVSRSGNTATTVTVNYATSDDTAKSGSDYTASSGTLTFDPGVTSQVIKIPIIDDNAHEGTEDFFVALSNPSSSAQIGSPSQAVVVIHDNDAAATPTPSPTASGTPPTVELLNISARALVQTGDAVAVAGFIIRGDDQTTKRIVVRGLGPSLPTSNDLQDPVLELHEANGATIEINDNWQQGPHSTDVATAGLAPTDPRESAIYRVLPPGSYTAVMHGTNNGTGIGLVEVYDLDASSTNYVADLSSRAFVSTGDNALIDGLILRGGAPQRIMLRAIGPDLQTERDVSGALQDPTLELHDSNGLLIAFNDDWRSDQENEIIATGLAPHDDRDSALLRTLSAGNYTAIVRGKGGTTGVALGEIYNLGNP